MASLGKLRSGVQRLLGAVGTTDFERYRPVVEAAGRSDSVSRGLSDADLAVRVAGLRSAGAEWNAQDLADFCAVAREAARRSSIAERPFDVQLMGALALLDAHIVEMNTGEGKTLTGAIAAAGYALRGRQVHVLSVNDYLARRDAEWMLPLYATLGVSVGWITEHSTRAERRAAYACDVSYVSVSEAGFDVLRDRIRTDPAEDELTTPDVVIVDEADAVLIDEATIPLVLAGTVDGEPGRADVAELVRSLRAGVHFEVEDDGRSVALSDDGIDEVERMLGGVNLFSSAHSELLSGVNVALHAQVLLHRDVDYVVRDGRVELVNAARGRVALLQRWPDGLQAAVEAKEGLAASPVGQILDSMTVQSVIGRYRLVCGMSGTAVAVAQELNDYFGLRTGALPPNVPRIRHDEPDRTYATRTQKQRALVEYVLEAHSTGRPVLIGTLSVAESEELAAALLAVGIDGVVLNAKNDAEEAAIISRAGEYGGVTISTQMAGRGTDIRLGAAGSESGGESGAVGDESAADRRERIAALGGLCVVGFGRYHSVRLDDQLRGRAGRQGDPGSSVFFTSMEDELVRRNAPAALTPAALASIVAAQAADAPDGRLRDKRVDKAVRHAQRAAEGAQQVIRENTLRYAELVDSQRKTVLEVRAGVLSGDDAALLLQELSPERFFELERVAPAEVLAEACRLIVLYHLDERWMEHLAVLADAREGIHLRALSRDSPVAEFNKVATREFHSFFDEVDEASAETFRSAMITRDGIDLDALGLKRPSATWTYMVTDDPFGSPEMRFVNVIGTAIRRAVRPGAEPS